MKVLFLDSGNDQMNEIFRRERSKIKNCNSQCIYKNGIKRGYLFKIIQFFGYYFFSPILYIIYGEWKKEIDQYDIFIIPSRRPSKYAARMIKKRKKRVIIWYWNSVSKSEMNPLYCQKRGYETWSFDINDCKKYGMKFGDTYYFELPYTKKINEKNDIFYIGINKPGREEFINNIKKYLNQKNISNKIILCEDNNKSKKEINNDKMDYEQVLNEVVNSKAILEINKTGQSGLSLRPMECIFFQKKLITNNKNIKDYYAYDDNNTLIIDGNNFDEIEPFLQRKTEPSSLDKKKYYSFEGWLNRIINHKEGVINDWEKNQNKIKTLAGIVLYNPDMVRLKKNIDSIIKQVDLLLLIDNASENKDEIDLLISNYKNIIVFRNDKNEGLSRALNQILDYSYENKYDWFLTLDQDSIVNKHTIKEYLKYVNQPNVAIVTSHYIDLNVEVKEKRNDNIYNYVEFCITSGSLCNTKVIKSINGFDEQLFIDCIDYDICSTLIEHGYKIIKINNNGFYHEVGKSKRIKFLFFDEIIYNHNVTRTYYIIRNMHYYMDKHKKSINVIKWKIRIIKKELLILLFENDKKEKFKAIIRAINDYKKKKMMDKNERRT